MKPRKRWDEVSIANAAPAGHHPLFDDPRNEVYSALRQAGPGNDINAG